MHRVVTRLNVGGPALHVVGLSRQPPPGTHPHALLHGSLGPGEADLGPLADRAGIRHVQVPGLHPARSGMDDLRALCWLAERFRAERPDVVHTHTAKAGAVGRAAALLAGVPIRVHTYHGHVLGGSYFSAVRTAVYRGIERLLARVTHRLCVLTQRQAEELRGILRLRDPDRMTVVPLGLDLEGCLAVDRTRARDRLRAELGLLPEAVLVGSVGRVVPVKDHDLLLEAFAALLAWEEEAGSARAAHLVVAGGGEPALLERLRARVSELGLEDRVHWLGWRDDVAEVMAGLDVLALTSKDEGTPVAVIEALAAGTPVAAVDVGGVAEVLDDLPHCGLAAERTPDAFARVVVECLSRGPGEGGLPRDARKAVVRRYALSRLAADLGVVYHEEAARLGLTTSADGGT